MVNRNIPLIARILAAIFGTTISALPSLAAEAEIVTTVFIARKIVTMERNNPEAHAVAVNGKRVVSVGSLSSVKAALGDKPYKVDSICIRCWVR